MRSSKPALTRRLFRRYQEILAGWQGHNYNYSWVGDTWAWAAYGFAKRWHSRSIDLKRLATIVLHSDNPECCYRFARDVPGANVKRFQRQVMRHGNAELMRTFAREVPGAHKESLEQMAIVAEIMLD